MFWWHPLDRFLRGKLVGLRTLRFRPASRGSDRGHLLGASPLFFHLQRGTPLQMEEQGDLRSGGDGTEGSAGLPPRRPVARTPALCVRSPWRQRADYGGMQVSCGGQGMAWALPGRKKKKKEPWDSSKSITRLFLFLFLFFYKEWCTLYYIHEDDCTLANAVYYYENKPLQIWQ